MPRSFYYCHIDLCNCLYLVLINCPVNSSYAVHFVGNVGNGYSAHSYRISGICEMLGLFEVSKLRNFGISEFEPL